MPACKKDTFRPMLEALEGREVPATVTTPPVWGGANVASSAGFSAAAAPTLSQSVLAYVAARVNVRVGGGECAHLVTEALRQSGGEFIFTATDIRTIDHGPRADDYVWGTLVRIFDTARNPRDSNPAAAVKPGDVLQYYNARFTNGTFTIGQHTSVVAAVNAQGLPTQVYEQNSQQRRFVVRSGIDLTTMTAGWVRVYRPTPLTARNAPFKYTITNNTNAAVTISIGSSRFTMGRANTAQSHAAFYSGQTTLTIPGVAPVSVKNAAGYEIYTASTGKPALRVHGGVTTVLPVAPERDLTPPIKTYFTVRNATSRALTFKLDGVTATYSLPAGRVGYYSLATARPVIQLSNGKRFFLVSGSFEIYAPTSTTLGVRYNSAAIRQTFTIRNATRTTLTFTIYGTGTRYTLAAGRSATYSATNANPFIELSGGKRFKLQYGGFEVYTKSVGVLGFRWN